MKVVVVGNIGVGKTSIIRRFVGNAFPKHYKATVGVDFALKVIQIDEKTTVQLQLWDIAGQERFGTMTKIYYKKALGALVVFDVTELSSFQAVEKWVKDIRDKIRDPDDIPMLLVGNKSDTGTTSVVTNEQIEEAATKFGMIGWKVTSAKENKNIEESIDTLLKNILTTMVPEETKDTVSLGEHQNQTTQPNEGSCCGFGGEKTD
uniref:Ras-related protein Rab n=1 Tax=Arcella intermedia TaxID=1963864 RepID=A0A6B2LI57_9EUKA